MLRRFAYLLVLVPGLAFAGDEPPAGKAAPPPPPPEIKKTVDAFKGKSTFEVSLTMPGAPGPIKAKMPFDCKVVAGGSAVSCGGKANMGAGGVFDGQFMVAYDPFGKAVHFMAVNNQGEVHDHICHWKDDNNLACDSLKGTGPMGAITEDMNMVWDGKKVTFESVTVTADGKKMTFSGVGTRK